MEILVEHCRYWYNIAATVAPEKCVPTDIVDRNSLAMLSIDRHYQGTIHEVRQCTQYTFAVTME